MEEERIKCSNCKTSYDKIFLIGKQGNADSCPMCGAQLSKEDEHPDWITWYYYKDTDCDDTFSLWDKPPLNEDGMELVVEFKAPPKSVCGLDEVKRILRTYVPNAFAETPPPPRIQCPYCLSYDYQLVPRKFSLLTGFATNNVDRVCARCKRRF